MTQIAAATLTGDAQSAVVDHLVVNDASVVAEAQRWTSGERGVRADPAEIGGADVTAFVHESLRIGALAIAATGSERESAGLEKLIREVGDRASASQSAAALATQQAATDAADLVTKASDAVKKTLTATDEQTRKQFTATVAAAKTDLHTEIQRLVGGENPELVDRLRLLLDRFGSDLDAKVGRQTGELLEKAAKQFDPSDPTSPMAKHSTQLANAQTALVATLNEQHRDLTAKVDELSTALKVQQDLAKFAKRTPLKGGTFEDEIDVVLQEIAAGLGDEYTSTGAFAGKISRSKKGDGVLTVGDGSARVVLEMTDSARQGWSAYLDEAERNREAAASLGLVRTVEQNAGNTIRVLGPRRFVMAFDPAVDDLSLLRTAVQLRRTAAIAACANGADVELSIADERLAEAVLMLEQIDDIKKVAGNISKNAIKIDGQCDTFVTGIGRLLSQARDALGRTSGSLDPADTAEPISGAA